MSIGAVSPSVPFPQWSATAHDSLLPTSVNPGCGMSVLVRSLVDNELQFTDKHIRYLLSPLKVITSRIASQSLSAPYFINYVPLSLG